MTETELQNILYSHFRSRNIVLINNFRPKGWWECDLYTISSSRYTYEYEIKLTVADYLRDIEKEMDGKYKHDMLQEGDGPSFFSYVVPTRINFCEDIPAWAGLIEIDDYGDVHVVGKPTRLHKRKAGDEEINHITKTFKYRYWDLRLRIDNENNEKKGFL